MKNATLNEFLLLGEDDTPEVYAQSDDGTLSVFFSSCEEEVYVHDIFGNLVGVVDHQHIKHPF